MGVLSELFHAYPHFVSIRKALCHLRVLAPEGSEVHESFKEAIGAVETLEVEFQKSDDALYEAAKGLVDLGEALPKYKGTCTCDVGKVSPQPGDHHIKACERYRDYDGLEDEDTVRARAARSAKAAHFRELSIRLEELQWAKDHRDSLTLDEQLEKVRRAVAREGAKLGV